MFNVPVKIQKKSSENQTKVFFCFLLFMTFHSDKKYQIQSIIDQIFIFKKLQYEENFCPVYASMNHETFLEDSY